MSKFYYTSTQLLASIKRRAFVPESQTTFSDQDFLDFATEEMNMGIVPTVIEAQQDYYLYEELIPIETGVKAYDIPYRAIGNKIRDISFIDSSGSRSLMTRMGLADQVYNNTVRADKPYAYFMTGAAINLIVDENTIVNNGSSLAVSYYLRPNTLVPNDEVSVIQSMSLVVIDPSTTVLQIETTGTLPEAFETGTLFDIIKAKSPHNVVKFDLEVYSVNMSNNLIQFISSQFPANYTDLIKAGDFVALATETCVPQIPSDMHVMLAVRVASQILQALGDTEGLATSNTKLGELQANTKTLITERVEDSPMKIVNRNSTIRRSRSYRGFRGRG